MSRNKVFEAPKIVIDFEGTITPASFDYAKMIIENIVRNKILYRDREQYKNAIFDDGRFDACDDEWYFASIESGYPDIYRHSTGTSPWPVNLAAAAVGFGTRKMVDYQLATVKLSPGVDDLMEFISFEKNQKPYIVTNSYPAGALGLARKLHIPWSKVRTQGLQVHNVSKEIEEECENRVPMDFFVKNASGVKCVLDRWLEVAEKMLPHAKARNVEGIVSLMPEYENVFKTDNTNLSEILKYMFMPPDETAIMGGYNKGKVVAELQNKDKKVIAFGDSIVDGMMLGAADIGVSVNCTNQHAVEHSDISLCVIDYKSLIPMLGDMIDGRFKIDEAKTYQTDKLKIFTRKEILDAVKDEETWKKSEIKAANSASKNTLKELFKPSAYVPKAVA